MACTSSKSRPPSLAQKAVAGIAPKENGPPALAGRAGDGPREAERLVERERRSRGQNQGALHDVLEFPDVARPRIRSKGVHHRGRDGDHPHVHSARSGGATRSNSPDSSTRSSLAWSVHAEIADFVKEQRPAVGDSAPRRAASWGLRIPCGHRVARERKTILGVKASRKERAHGAQSLLAAPIEVPDQLYRTRPSAWKLDGITRTRQARVAS
jgi:hypothetical protein